MSPLLWSPSLEDINATQMHAFMQYCRDRHHFEGESYEDFHQWSVCEISQFWAAIWDYFKVSGKRSDTILQNAEDMLGARWFEGAQLNFAENLLRREDDAVALMVRGEDGRSIDISYRELKISVAKLAAYMREQGITKGDRIAGFVPNSHHALIAMLAAASLGAIWSSCSPDFGLNGVLDRFSQIEPSILFATNGYFYGGKRIDTLARVAVIAEKLDSLKQVVLIPYLDKTECDIATLDGTNWRCWDDIQEQHDETRLTFEAMAFSDPLYILYSSGTTGKPKCIVHSIGGTLLQHIKELALHTDVKRDTRLFYYTTCGWMMWNWLVSGLALEASIVLYDGSPFHPQKTVLFDIAERDKIQIFGASAKYYAACQKFELSPINTHCLDQLKSLLSTGSPLAHESFDYLYEHVKRDVCVSSISGGTDIVSCFALGNPVLPVYRGELQCIGLGMDVDFFNAQGEPLRSGKGELVCKQPFPSMPTGFWNDEHGEKYRSAYFDRFAGCWAHGDYGEFITHTDGQSPAAKIIQKGVVIHGRSDAVLNPGGVRIGTAEIYRQVDKIDEVFESLAVGQNWEDDLRIVLFVRLQEGHVLDEPLKQKIKDTIRANTTPRHVPAKIVQIADIPRTLSGKMVEIAVRKVIHNEAVNNTEALANPEALKLFENLKELQS